MNIYATILLLYLAAMIIFGIWCSKKYNTYGDYMVGGRKMPSYLLIATLIATAAGGAHIFGVVEKTNATGLSGMWYPMGLGVGYLVLALTLAKKMRRIAAENNIYTVPQLMRFFYKDDRVSLVAALITALGFTIVVAPQIMGGAAIITVLTGINKVTATILASIIVIFYTAIGGLWAVVWTDFVQTIIIYLGLIIVAIVSLNTVGGFEGIRSALDPSFFQPFSSAGIMFLVTVVISTTLNIFTDQGAIQRVFAAKDEKTAVYSCLGELVFGAIPLMFLLTVIGMAGKVLYPDVAGKTLYPHMLQNLLSPTIGAILLGSLAAALMSTSDSCLLAASTPVIEDVYHKYIKPDASEAELRKTGILITIALGVISTVIALYAPTIISVVILSFSIKASGLFFPLVIKFTKYKDMVNAEGAFWAIVLGGGIAVIWYIMGKPFGINEVYIGVPVSIIASLLITSMTKSKGVSEVVKK